MRKTVYLIHGFNVKDGGAQTTDLFAPMFAEAGFRVKELDYGFYGRVRVRLCNDSIAKVVARTLIPDSLVVAHSNGCDLVYRAAQHGARFDRAVLINPALDADKAIKGAKSVHVWYSRHDPWTGLSKLIPFSNWGAQGRVGYKGNDPRYENFNEGLLFGGRIGHSDVFRKESRLRTIFHNAVSGSYPNE